MLLYVGERKEDFGLERILYYCIYVGVCCYVFCVCADSVIPLSCGKIICPRLHRSVRTHPLEVAVVMHFLKHVGLLSDVKSIVRCL